MSIPSPLFRPLFHLADIRAAFVPRVAGIAVDADRATVLARLAPSHGEYLRAKGFDPASLATAEQVHGGEAAVADAPGVYSGVDALVTSRPGITLGIYVADCAAVYVADTRGRAIGLVHSGRAGTAANITGRTVGLMCTNFAIDPADLVVQISPCIRPPLYETDFAEDIAAQARAAGVREVIDDGICTGRQLANYYSYRVERGRTGRMLAALALKS